MRWRAISTIWTTCRACSTSFRALAQSTSGFLVVNAGVQFNFEKERTVSKQNIEQMMAVNHVAHSFPCASPGSQLRQSTLAGGARMVLVSSDVHKAADVAFFKSASLESASFSSLQADSNSKLANVAFAAEFSRCFKIDAVSLHPGVIASNFRQNWRRRRLLTCFWSEACFRSSTRWWQEFVTRRNDERVRGTRHCARRLVS